MNVRKITSLTLIIASVVELITSIVLYIIPSGRVAYWSDYRLWGLSKTQWGDIHIAVGTLLVIGVATHIYYNWRPITAYLKNQAKQLTVFNKNFNIALIITLYVVGGTVYSLPPMSYLLNLGEHISDLGNEKYGEPPYGHAELSSLKMFCSRMNIDLENAVDSLKNANIKLNDTKETILQIAKNNGKTPKQLYETIKPTPTLESNGKTPFPENPSPNFGRKTLTSICQTYNLSLDEVMSRISQAGFAAQSDDTVKEIGMKNNSNPMAIFEILKELSQANK
ncbi:DUF4405 domain-containing protein [bacterium]|nr:DUF4405 domain-containing protein [bacterium]